MSYQNLFDTKIADTFKNATRLLIEYPQSAAALLKITAHEAKAKKQRHRWLDEGVSVPPLLIVSTTDNCNLQCKECYAAKPKCDNSIEMKKERIDTLLDEASAAGCSTILLAGGEPLLAPDWMTSVAEHREILGLVFTNGTLFNEKWLRFFSSNRHMLPLFSVEGLPERTDDRRGSGIAKQIKSVMSEMYQRKIPFGISVTTGSHNIDEVTTADFINPYIEHGCRLIIHVEYVPMGVSEDFSPLSREEKLRLPEYCTIKTREGKAIFVAFPGKEELFGGCLAAGRGFLHIAASGAVEPCPFAPYSDRDLTHMSFIEALKSPLLKALRAEADSLHEGTNGCSLRNKEAWIHEIKYPTASNGE